jgi:hypothetical protein
MSNRIVVVLSYAVGAIALFSADIAAFWLDVPYLLLLIANSFLLSILALVVRATRREWVEPHPKRH